MTDRDKIRAAFKAIRSAGVKARMNYKCCMGCALAAAEDELGLKPDENFVYYHNQDAYSIGSDGRLVRPLMIRFSGVSAPLVAVAALNAAGLNATWKGDRNYCVQVTS